VGDESFLLRLDPTSQRICRTFIEVAALSFPPPYLIHIIPGSTPTETNLRTFESSASFPAFCFLPASFLSAVFLSVVFLAIRPMGLGRLCHSRQHVTRSRRKFSLRSSDKNPTREADRTVNILPTVPSGRPVDRCADCKLWPTRSLVSPS